MVSKCGFRILIFAIFSIMVSIAGTLYISYNSAFLTPNRINSNTDINTKLIGSWKETGAVDFFDYTDYGILAAGESLFCVHYSSEDDLSLSSELDIGYELIDMDIQGKYAYIIDKSESLNIVNISNICNFQLITRYTGLNTAKKITVNGSNAYIASYRNGLKILDISNSTEPKLCSGINFEGEARDSEAIGKNLLIASDEGLKIYDLSNASEPVEISTMSSVGIARGITIRSNTAYVACDRGLRTIDITNISDASILDYVMTGHNPSDVFLNEEIAYVPSPSSGVAIVNIKHPDDLNVLGSFGTLVPVVAKSWNNIMCVCDSVYGFFLYIIDSDGDGISDIDEAEYGTNPTLSDSDADLLSDYTEIFETQTDPLNPDSDSDTCTDGWEVQWGFDPLLFDSDLDPDDDDLTNEQEFLLGTNPTNWDSDNDSLPDSEIYDYGTNPLSSDSDNDTLPDGYEVMFGLDPLVNDAQSDKDNDGLSNILEFNLGTNPSSIDTDNDGFSDYYEYMHDMDPLTPNFSSILFPVAVTLLFSAISIAPFFAKKRKFSIFQNHFKRPQYVTEQDTLERVENILPKFDYLILEEDFDLISSIYDYLSDVLDKFLNIHYDLDSKEFHSLKKRIAARYMALPNLHHLKTRSLIVSILVIISLIPSILLRYLPAGLTYFVYTYPLFIAITVGYFENRKITLFSSLSSLFIMMFTNLYYQININSILSFLYATEFLILLVLSAVIIVLTVAISKIKQFQEFNSRIERYVSAADYALDYDRNLASLLYERVFATLNERSNYNYRNLPEYQISQYKHVVMQLSKLEPDKYDESILDTPDSFDSILEEMKAPAYSTTGDVKSLRGCELVGGHFEYKVKVDNDSGFVITNVRVTIVSYPEESLNLTGDRMRSVNRIEVGGFRSLQFLFGPTKDCVEGTIQALVSYTNPENVTQNIEVQPYTIKSVCDLLKKKEISLEGFIDVQKDMNKSSKEFSIDWNSIIAFNKIQQNLTSKNFHIVSLESESAGGQFIGSIRGFAEGKYTGKRIAVMISVTGFEEGASSRVRIDILGDDVSMLPTILSELADTIDSWNCINCGAAFDTADVIILKTGGTVICRFCETENSVENLSELKSE